MACYRKRDDCKELFAMEADGGSQCVCMGLVNSDARIEPEYSKRICLAGTDPHDADVQLDFADQELMVLQHVISGGFMEVLQQARRNK